MVGVKWWLDVSGGSGCDEIILSLVVTYIHPGVRDRGVLDWRHASDNELKAQILISINAQQ